MEIPIGPARGPHRAGGPFVEGKRFRSGRHLLRRQRKGDAECALTERFNFAFGFRFLVTEIVRRHAKDDEARLLVTRPKLLQPGVLFGVAAERCGVDDQQHLAAPDASFSGLPSIPGNAKSYAEPVTDFDGATLGADVHIAIRLALSPRAFAISAPASLVSLIIHTAN